MDDQLYEINVKRFIQSTEYQLKKLNECISRLNEVFYLLHSQLKIKIITGVLIFFSFNLMKIGQM